mgnify:CR=1 FL=1
MPLSEDEKRELAELRKLQTPEEPGFGEKGKALAYGAATGLAGGLGELEKFAAYDIPEFLGFREQGERDKLVGRETLFPTIQEAQQVLGKVGIEKPREDVSGYQTAGEIIGGFGTALPGIVRSGTKALLGATTKLGEQSAKAAEKLGFKLSPSQVRAEGPVGERGAVGFTEHNQDLANKLASKGTGKEATFVDDKFIKERLSTLGKEFDNVYKGKIFNIDQNAVLAIQDILRDELAAIGPSGTSAVKSAAEDIVKNFQQLASRTGAQPGSFAIEGEGLQKLRNALTERARSTSRTNAREIYELVDVVDDSIARNHPQVAAKLDDLRPKYRNSIILEDLYRSGGIQRGDISLERLGNMLRTERSVVRRTGQDIDELAKLGRENKIRARWETTGVAPAEGQEVLKKTLGIDLPRALSYPLRTRAARAAQRYYGTEPQTMAGRAFKAPASRPVAGAITGTAAGTATRPFQEEEQ